MINKVYYLGPKGSYSELAKNEFASYFLADVEFVIVDSIYKTIEILINSDLVNIAAILPIENSLEGIVRETQDNLARLAQKGYRIQAEKSIVIEHFLVGFGEMEDIKIIMSHPQALAQCREYIYKNWGDKVETTPTLSTSSAVATLNPDKKEVAAIGSSFSAQIYNVPVLCSNINDEKNNTTRFVLLSKLQPKKSTLNKVSITFSTENKAGSLKKVLNILDKYSLNMSYINSRPSRKELGEYVFYIDFTGHIEDGQVLLALTEIQNVVDYFELLSEGAVCV